MPGARRSAPPPSGPSMLGVAWSIGTLDAPGDGPCPVERPLWAACSSPLCASTLRRGLPPGKAGRVDPRETQKARLKRTSATAAEDAAARVGSGRFGGPGDARPSQSSSRPCAPAPPRHEKHPFPVTASSQRPPTPPPLCSGGGRVPHPPYERPRRPRANPRPGAPSGARPVCRKQASRGSPTHPPKGILPG